MSGRGWRPLWVVAVVALLLLPTGARTQDSGHSRSKWWKDNPFRQELGLTDEQSSKIDAIFQSTVPVLRQQYDTSKAEERQLQKLVDANESEDVVSRQIDKADESRCAFNKTRVLMLYKMRLVLSPEQRAKFRKVHDDWERQRRKSAGGHLHNEG